MEPIIPGLTEKLSPNNYIYISHLDDEAKFWILPSWPDSISDSMQTNFNSQNALGRSAPVWTYSNSGPRTVQLDINVQRDLLDDINMGVSNSKLSPGEDYLENLIHALQAIALPRYNLSNKAVEPPLILLRLGNELFIKGIVSGAVGVTYEKPIQRDDRYAKARISISINEIDPYDATTVYKNGSFRGYVKPSNTGLLSIED